MLKKMVAMPLQFVQGVYHKSVTHSGPTAPNMGSSSELPADESPQASPSGAAVRKKAVFDYKRMLIPRAESLPGTPPQGYLWLYLGKFRRWQRRFFVASTTGVLHGYKKSDQDGKVLTITLKDTRVEEDETNPRQLKLVSPTGTIFLRVIHSEERAKWVQCLRHSAEAYQKNLQVVENLKEIAAPEEPVSSQAFAKEHLIPVPGELGLELAPDQRRKLRQRLLECIKELAPYEQEVERHSTQLHQQLSAIVESLQPVASSSSFKPPVQPAVIDENEELKLPLGTELAPGLKVPPPTPALSQYGTPVSSVPQSHLGTGDPPTPTAEASSTAPGHPIPPAAAQLGLEQVFSGALTGSEAGGDRALSSLLSRVKRADNKPTTTKVATLPQAALQYFERVRLALHKEVMRNMLLEEENAALLKSLAVFRTKAGQASGAAKSRVQSLHNLPRTSQPAADHKVDESDSDDFLSVMDDVGERDLAGFDEDDNEDDNEEEKKLLTALEAVRQVEYVARNVNADPLNANDEPPSDIELDEDKDDKDDETVALEDGDGHVGRVRLPAPQPLGRGFSIWSILKNAIGRDLTKITMPATINEPLSVLQRMAEDMEYASLLEKAADCTCSADRMMYIALFVLSSYNSQVHRNNKPFNPLLGETYEWQSPDTKYRFLSEQVSHHPPVSCCYAEGSVGSNVQGSFELYGELETRTKFWGRSLELIMCGHMALNLRPWGDEYRWPKAKMPINNIILGNFWLECIGPVKITNKATGDVAKLELLPCQGRLEKRGNITGSIRNAAGEEVWSLSGNYMKEITATHVKGGQPPVTWVRAELPEDAEEQYMFTKCAIALNDPASPLVPVLPPTDARFRPDQRALELGDHTRATSEKLRLEDKQRKARHARKEAGEEYRSHWFDQVNPEDAQMIKEADNEGAAWKFNGQYWNRKYDGCPDIY